MRVITYCDVVKNPQYLLLRDSVFAQGHTFENVWEKGVKWEGFFKRWDRIAEGLRNRPKDEPVAIVDGLDVFVLGPLWLAEQSIQPGVIGLGLHGAWQRCVLPNTCNRNVGVLLGQAGDLLRVAEFFRAVPLKVRKSFHDCDQSYLNYILNHTSEIPGISFQSTPVVYMNSDDRLTVEAVFYHAVGMHDYYHGKTSQILKERLNYTTQIPFKVRRYLGYVWKWLAIEARVVYGRARQTRGGKIMSISCS